MKDGIKHNAPVKTLELGQEELQAISGGISDQTRDMLEQMKKDMLQKASRAADGSHSEAANACSDVVEYIAMLEDGYRQEDGQSE